MASSLVKGLTLCKGGLEKGNGVVFLEKLTKDRRERQLGGKVLAAHSRKFA